MKLEMTEIIEVARDMGWQTHDDKIIHPVIGYIASDKDLYIIKRELMLAICEKMGWGITKNKKGWNGRWSITTRPNMDGEYKYIKDSIEYADLPLAIIHAYYRTVCHKED